MEGYISTEEAGRVLKISRQSVWRLIQRGTLPASRVGRQYFVRKAVVQQLADDPKRLLRTRRELEPGELEQIGNLILEEFEDKGLVTRARRLLREEDDAA
jgi:excisionase family DNA binding protein